MTTSTAKPEIVVVGWDGRSDPIFRYRDDVHLPDHQQRIVAPEHRPVPTKAWSPLGGTVPVVRSIPRRSSFQFAYDGFDFYMVSAGALVAVAR